MNGISCCDKLRLVLDPNTKKVIVSIIPNHASHWDSWVVESVVNDVQKAKNRAYFSISLTGAAIAGTLVMNNSPTCNAVAVLGVGISLYAIKKINESISHFSGFYQAYRILNRINH